MEITKETALAEILSSNDVITTINTAQTRIKSKIFDRELALAGEMKSGGLSPNEVIINGKAVLYEGARKVEADYGEVKSLMESTLSDAKVLAINKEKEELNKLRELVVKEIASLNNKITAYDNYKYTGINIPKEYLELNERNHKRFCDFREIYEKKLRDIDRRIASVGTTNDIASSIPGIGGWNNSTSSGAIDRSSKLVE